MKRWYVVHTPTHQEARAELNLSRQGLAVWLPLFRRARRYASRIDHVLSPLFPRYLFVQLDLTIQRWRAINGTFGVVRLLCSDDMPLPVPDGLVERIMRRRDQSGAVVLSPGGLAVGEAVRISLGPFVDLEGLRQEMSGRDRVVLLLNLLGQKVWSNVPVAGLAP
jgi:transcriptional antiterminator RfaH